MATFDNNQVKEYINRVENDTAEFIGAEFCGARLIGNISQQHAQRDLSDAQARQLIDDAHHLMELAKLGHSYAKKARNPSPEVEIMVMAKMERLRQGERQ